MPLQENKAASDIETILNRVEQIVGASRVKTQSVAGGYTAAYRSIVEFANGSSAFVKAATDDLTANWLRAEYRIYKNIETEFMPKLIGWHDDGGLPVLILEDLSHGLWPKSWTPEMIQKMINTASKIKNTKPPFELPKLASMRDDFASWRLVAEQPEAFLRLNLCSADWLNKALPKLLEADENAALDGEELLHLDIRSDNICFLDDRVILVDWNWACAGNAALDLVAWAPTVTLEGGPMPEEIVQNEPAMIALLTGYWAYRAGMPPPFPGSTVRDIQRKVLEVALPWCARALGLPSPP
jgi:hypothetical protein